MSIDFRFRRDHRGFRLELDESLPDNGVSVIFGPSGCGKTSLLRLLAGLDRDPRGYCRFGRTVWQDTNTFRPAHLRPLGYVFQEASLFPHLDVAANLEFARKRAGNPVLDLDEVIELLAIEHLLPRASQSLSGGERQRVAIARALASQPRLLLLDEPLAAIDSRHKQEIIHYLQRLFRHLRIPVVHVSHSLEEAAMLGDYLLIMADGKPVARGEMATMLTRLDGSLEGNPPTSLIHGRLTSVDPRDQLASIRFSGGELLLPANGQVAGGEVRVLIKASDVSIALQKPRQSSILNSFTAVVDELRPHETSQQLVRLKVGEDELLARISSRSVRQLGLQPGREVFVQVKAAALLS